MTEENVRISGFPSPQYKGPWCVVRGPGASATVVATVWTSEADALAIVAALNKPAEPA